jgi:hypothetical protein
VLRQDIKIQAIGHQSSAQGWDDELLRLVAAHSLDMSKVEDNAGFWSRSGAMDHDTALASAAALALAGGHRHARLDLAEALANHGFGTPALSIEDPASNESLRSHEIARGAIIDAVSNEIGKHTTGDRKSIREGVESSLSSATDLIARGEAAVDSFFLAKKEGNSLKAASALDDLERVIISQRAAHFDSTFEETRGVLKAAQDFDMAGQFGDFEVNAQALKGAGSAFNQAYREALVAGSGSTGALVAGLSATLRGYSNGFDDGVETRRERAFAEVTALGFPEAAARYYADESLLWQESIDKAVPRMLGQDETFERLKVEATEQLGERGLEMLARAATAEPIAKKQYLDGALSIYRLRSQPSAETSTR